MRRDSNWFFARPIGLLAISPRRSRRARLDRIRHGSSTFRAIYKPLSDGPSDDPGAVARDELTSGAISIARTCGRREDQQAEGGEGNALDARSHARPDAGGVPAAGVSSRGSARQLEGIDLSAARRGPDDRRCVPRFTRPLDVGPSAAELSGL